MHRFRSLRLNKDKVSQVTLHRLRLEHVSKELLVKSILQPIRQIVRHHHVLAFLLAERETMV